MATGTELRLKRTAMNVTIGDLAARMRVPASSISRWESAVRVTAKAEERYLTGLATFGTIPTVIVSHGQDAA